MTTQEKTDRNIKEMEKLQEAGVMVEGSIDLITKALTPNRKNND